MPLRTTHAHVLSLNGTPIHAGTPAPFLRRTRSGHLFEPEQSVIKTCEKRPPIPVDREDVEYGDVYDSLHGRPRGGSGGSVRRDMDEVVDDVVVDQMEARDEEVVGGKVTALERVRALAVVHGMPFNSEERVEVGEVKEGKGTVVDRDEQEETEAEMLGRRARTY